MSLASYCALIVKISVLILPMVWMILLIEAFFEKECGAKLVMGLWLLFLGLLSAGAFTLLDLVGQLSRTLGIEKVKTQLPMDMPQERLSAMTDFVVNQFQVDLPLSVQSGGTDIPTLHIYELWLFGVLGLVSLQLFKRYKFHRQLKAHMVPATAAHKACLVRGQTRLGIKNPIEICQSTWGYSPFVVGYFKPKVILPVAMATLLSAEELEMVIYHELAHIRLKDLLIIRWVSFLKCLFFFNPLLWLGFSRVLLAVERRCDAFVLDTMAGDCRKQYGHVLIKVAEYIHKPQVSLLALINFTSPLKRRISMIQHYKKMPHTVVSFAIVGFMTCVTIISALLFSGLGTGNVFAESKLTVQSVVSGGQTQVMSNPLGNQPITVIGPFGFKQHKTLNKKLLHSGVDLAAAEGTAVNATLSGRVIYADHQMAGYGNCIMIEHEGGLVTVYAQCSSLDAQVGDKVRQGQRIATVGNTGAASEAHLHFEMRVDETAIDPMPYLTTL